MIYNMTTIIYIYIYIHIGAAFGGAGSMIKSLVRSNVLMDIAIIHS